MYPTVVMAFTRPIVKRPPLDEPTVSEAACRERSGHQGPSTPPPPPALPNVSGNVRDCPRKKSSAAGVRTGEAIRLPKARPLDGTSGQPPSSAFPVSERLAVRYTTLPGEGPVIPPAERPVHITVYCPKCNTQLRMSPTRGNASVAPTPSAAPSSWPWRRRSHPEAPPLPTGKPARDDPTLGGIVPILEAEAAEPVDEAVNTDVPLLTSEWRNPPPHHEAPRASSWREPPPVRRGGTAHPASA